MATPRKHWVKIASSLLREPWPREQKLTLVLLCCYLNDRWARDGLTAEEACSADLDQGAMASITGRTYLKDSRRSLRSLEDLTGISVGSRGEITTIFWPKFAEFQSLGARSPGSNGAYADADADRTRAGTSNRQPSSKNVAPAKAVAAAEQMSMVPIAAGHEGEALVPGIPLPEDPGWDVATGRLVNLLGRKRGSREAKLEWLRENVESMAYKVRARTNGSAEQARAALCSSVISWYEQHLRTGGRRRAPETFTEIQSRENLEWLLKVSRDRPSTH